jgi:transcriptional regulator GlxA family with amidase domain
MKTRSHAYPFETSSGINQDPTKTAEDFDVVYNWVGIWWFSDEESTQANAKLAWVKTEDYCGRITGSTKKFPSFDAARRAVKFARTQTPVMAAA